MATYIVFALPVGAPAPDPDEPYPTTATITNAATEDGAVETVANLLEAKHNSVLWALDMSAMSQYVVSRSYTAAIG